MIKSMTGFGRYELSDAERKITVEIKSVNHRFLDVGIKMPKKFNFFEASIRNLIKEFVQRGKTDIFITYEDFSESKVVVKYNKDVAKEYLGYLEEMSAEFGIDNNISTTSLMRCPEVLTLEEQTLDEKELWAILENAIREAGKNLVETRIREGESLRDDIIAKLDVMLDNVAYIEKR